ncbi:hypothetical protein ACIRL2_29175 [Embleya sp. NPDC127516]|uniref:hypothetical protein n=1 Tax=Embleya sp. NPDC127516 TaxID=3363990 RepID=UPI0037F15AA9
MTTPDSIPQYRHWDDIPVPTLLTRTQHGDLDLPRVPAANPSARVTGTDLRGKPATYDLYDARNSTPSKSGPGRLLAMDQAVHTCEDCGARTERPAAVRHGQTRRLCPACALVDAIVTAQGRARVERAAQTAWAREVMADPRSVWVHVDHARRTRTATGRLRACPAVTVTAADHAGLPVLRTIVRLVAAGNTEVPPNAVDQATAAALITERLGGRRVIMWDAFQTEALTCLAPIDVDGRDRLDTRLPSWRGLVDTTGARVWTCLPPDRADRLLVATARMADTTDADTEHREWLNSGRGATVVDITGGDDDTHRIATILRAVGVLVDHTDTEPTRVPDAGGLVRLRVLCHRDGIGGPPTR